MASIVRDKARRQSIIHYWLLRVLAFPDLRRPK
jgi:hypothetical protein